MSDYIIPPQWSVGINAIDQEHQKLLDLLHHQGKSPPAESGYFNEFYDRLSNLMKQKTEHMEVTQYFYLKRTVHNQKNTLQQLRYLHASNQDGLLESCQMALLREISDAELYYNTLTLHFAKTG